MHGETPLSGNKAIEALDKYVQTLEEQETKGLTSKQANALIKAAKVLRNAISQNY